MPGMHGWITVWGFIVILRWKWGITETWGIEEYGQACTDWGKVFILHSVKLVLLLAWPKFSETVRKIWCYIIQAGSSCGPSFHTVKQSKDTPGQKPTLCSNIYSLIQTPLTECWGDFMKATTQCFSKAVLFFCCLCWVNILRQSSDVVMFVWQERAIIRNNTLGSLEQFSWNVQDDICNISRFDTSF